MRRPDLDNGIYIYAQAGFGHYAGFNAAWGYWASNVVGNVFFMIVRDGDARASSCPAWARATRCWPSLVASAGVWVFHLLIARGVRQATAINRIVTVAKLVPIVVFVIVTLVVVRRRGLRRQLLGRRDRTRSARCSTRCTDTMLVTTFVFLGIEGASVYSRLARRREDVGRATVLGFVSTLALFASVTLVSYGVLPQRDLAEARAAGDGRRPGVGRRRLGRDPHRRRRSSSPCSAPTWPGRCSTPR